MRLSYLSGPSNSYLFIHVFIYLDQIDIKLIAILLPHFPHARITRMYHHSVNENLHICISHSMYFSAVT